MFGIRGALGTAVEVLEEEPALALRGFRNFDFRLRRRNP